MIIDSLVLSGKCSCGREHSMSTKAAVIESGCLKDFEKYMESYAISGKRCALYGENSYKAVEGLRPAAEQEIVLKSDGFHANEISTAEVLALMEQDIEVLIAVGSGTIHDIARFCAHERGIRFVSVPTAASVDGFCSTVAAMTWYGFKNTMPAVAPEIVVADTDVIKAAPAELVKSGIGDIMAKYTALADWKIAQALCGEYVCERIWNMMHEAADTAMASVPGIIKGEDKAFADVTYALIMSGLAMQMMGNSRPASGCEHHISHMIEMGPEALEVSFSAMHGEKTGVGSVLGAAEYEKLAAIEDISPYVKEYEALDRDKLHAFFGDKLTDGVMEENASDSLVKVSAADIIRAWPEIRAIVAAMPSSNELFRLLEELDAKRTPEDIGVSSSEIPRLLDYSPLVRNRLTLMRARRMINLDKI